MCVCACVWVCSVAQSCLPLCNPMNCSPLCSSVHGICQSRILEWVVISYCRGYSQSRDQTLISCISCIGRRILYHWKNLPLDSLPRKPQLGSLVKLIYETVTIRYIFSKYFLPVSRLFLDFLIGSLKEKKFLMKKLKMQLTFFILCLNCSLIV